MDQFSAAPLLIGLVVAALLGAGSGLLAARSGRGRPIVTNPVGEGAGTLPSVLFWLGFVFGVIGGFYGISSSNTWLGILVYLLIAAMSAAATALPARAIRRRHNLALDAIGPGRGITD